jgi:hypothetical protein
MKYYLLKLIYLLFTYILMYFCLFCYAFIVKKFSLYCETNNFILIEKLHNNQIYHFKELLLDFPHVLNWLKSFRSWKFSFIYSLFFLSFLIIKPIQFISTLLMLPPFFFWFTWRFFKKKSITYNWFIKHNSSLFDIFLLLFFHIPVAYLFIRIYLVFKIIFEKKNRLPFNTYVFLNTIKIISYNFFYRTLFGMPLWNLVLVHEISRRVFINWCTDLENWESKRAPLLVWIRCILISSHNKSYIHTAWRSKIYFINNEPNFNPKKNQIKSFILQNKSANDLKTGLTNVLNKTDGSPKNIQ